MARRIYVAYVSSTPHLRLASTWHLFAAIRIHSHHMFAAICRESQGIRTVVAWTYLQQLLLALYSYTVITVID